MATNETSQLLKGVLPGCVLILLDQDADYGYALTQRLNDLGFSDVSKSTVYPLLTTMAKKGLLKIRRQASAHGPKRNYYTLTLAGEKARQQFLSEWRQLNDNVTRVMNAVGDEL